MVSALIAKIVILYKQDVAFEVVNARKVHIYCISKFM